MSQRQSELRSPNDDGIEGLGGKLIEREKPAKETGLPGLKLTHTHSHALYARPPAGTAPRRSILCAPTITN